ncbi:hypothetical protein E8E14_008736 [Neopestalotiopsis sp. 37M]|nr:hypothetical protein E8E14_008736 [Neopestalotiopsis sp. 37M]
MIIITAFTIAGGFSSRISSGMSDEVLINGDNCGIVAGGIREDMDAFEAFSRYTNRKFADAANYAQQCYSDDSSGMLSCDRFVVKELKAATIETNRSCPFHGDICRSNSANIRLDTGYIDSHDQFGLNAPPSERFGYRYVLECAPLKTEGHVTYVDLGNITWAQYNYGGHSTGTTDNTTSLDFTYEVQDLDYQYSKDYKGSVRGDFLVSNQIYRVSNGEIDPYRSTFTPIPELTRNDGDVTVIFLSGNGVYFWDPVDDDWYRATVKAKNLTSTDSNGSQQSYRPADAASPLGCVEQRQWCKSNSENDGGCGPLASSIDALNGASHLFNISGDVWSRYSRPYSNTSTASRFIWSALIGSVGDDNLNWAVGELKTSGLASRLSSFDGVQYALPSNQWHLDVQGWWNTLLAKMQANMVNVAVGHTDPLLIDNSWLPNNQYERSLCYKQKVRSADYASFSLFGLYFTYITGALIILIRGQDVLIPPPPLCQMRTWLVWIIEDLTHPILARPVKVEQEVVEVAQMTEDNSEEIYTGPHIQVDTGGAIAVVHAGEPSEEPTEDDLTNRIGRDSPISTIGHDSRDILQSTLSPAHSVSSDHVS